MCLSFFFYDGVGVFLVWLWDNAASGRVWCLVSRDRGAFYLIVSDGPKVQTTKNTRYGRFGQASAEGVEKSLRGAFFFNILGFFGTLISLCSVRPAGR